ncbi:hypothetical protein E2C01_095454 [Portunus trituberculatus]|uniref:Uncharacterized protein n=1 Tax=Portunus trituberculatus TaxID=210409 RepID=A0A5B7K3W0_PORTR|nr:hypothetical protein [Portunus trituberculatus]
MPARDSPDFVTRLQEAAKLSYTSFSSSSPLVACWCGCRHNFHTIEESDDGKRTLDEAYNLSAKS